jgi:hypothetical protein
MGKKGRGGERTKKQESSQEPSQESQEDSNQILTGRSNSVIAVAVDNGVTSNKGRGGNLIVM